MRWVQPLSLVIIAAVGDFIAWQQLDISRVKSRHDLYDRRYPVFQVARAFFADSKSALSRDSLSDRSYRRFKQA
jgi:hypothetical protein